MSIERETGYDRISFARGTEREIRDNIDKLTVYEPAIATDQNKLLFKAEDGVIREVGLGTDSQKEFDKKLDKGGYSATAQDLKNDIDSRYTKTESDGRYKPKNRGLFMKVDVPETVWTSAPAMSGKTSVGGLDANTGSGTDGYLSLSSSTGKLHLFVDGDVYTNEGRDKVYTTGSKPSPADIGALPTGGGNVTGTLTMNGGGRIDFLPSNGVSVIDFKNTGSNNDRGWIKHFNSSSTANMQFVVSDDPEAGDDYFTFGAASGNANNTSDGTYTEWFKVNRLGAYYRGKELFKASSLGTLPGNTVGNTSGWATGGYAPGFYTRTYSGYSGLCYATGRVGGSTAQIIQEMTYNGNFYIHSNTDSKSWSSHKIYTSANKPRSGQRSTDLYSGDLGTGSFTLSQSFYDFDYVVFVTATDDNGRYASKLFFRDELEFMRTTYNKVELACANWYWTASIGSDRRTFTIISENSRIRRVYGGNY